MFFFWNILKGYILHFMTTCSSNGNSCHGISVIYSPPRPQVVKSSWNGNSGATPGGSQISERIREWDSENSRRSQRAKRKRKKKCQMNMKRVRYFPQKRMRMRRRRWRIPNRLGNELGFQEKEARRKVTTSFSSFPETVTLLWVIFFLTKWMGFDVLCLNWKFWFFYSVCLGLKLERNWVLRLVC